LPENIDFETAYKWSWAKKWFGNTEAWNSDPLLQLFLDKYNKYIRNEKLYGKDLKRLQEKNPTRYAKIKTKNKTTIAQYLACEDIMNKVEKNM